MDNFFDFFFSIGIADLFDAVNYLNNLHVPTTVLVCWAAAALTAAIAVYKTIAGHAMTIRNLKRWRELEAQTRGETS